MNGCAWCATFQKVDCDLARIRHEVPLGRRPERQLSGAPARSCSRSRRQAITLGMISRISERTKFSITLLAAIRQFVLLTAVDATGYVSIYRRLTRQPRFRSQFLVSNFAKSFCS
jgi:hypothetical protein